MRPFFLLTTLLAAGGGVTGAPLSLPYRSEFRPPAFSQTALPERTPGSGMRLHRRDEALRDEGLLDKALLDEGLPDEGVLDEGLLDQTWLAEVRKSYGSAATGAHLFFDRPVIFLLASTAAGEWTPSRAKPISLTAARQVPATEPSTLMLLLLGVLSLSWLSLGRDTGRKTARRRRRRTAVRRRMMASL